jgi:hypothetical protein
MALAQGRVLTFQMISQADARTRMDRAIAAGECPQQPDEAGNVASRRALLRARAAVLRRGERPPAG